MMFPDFPFSLTTDLRPALRTLAEIQAEAARDRTLVAADVVIRSREEGERRVFAVTEVTRWRQQPDVPPPDGGVRLVRGVDL